MTEAAASNLQPEIESFFDEATNTVSYLVSDPVTRKAAVIDPVLDYDIVDGKASTASVERILSRAADKGVDIIWALETHAHADHLSGSPFVKAKTGAKIGIGSAITEVQEIFRPVFNATDLKTDGSDFDRLFEEGERFGIGEIGVRVIHTPGHTPACITYVMGRHAFVGDTIFMPDFGIARADFPGGDAAVLYDSIQKLFALPGNTVLHLCHDYKAPGRDVFAWETTVAEEREKNIHLGGGVSRGDFVKMRTERDAMLKTPRLLLPSIQTNIRAGNFPPAEENGVHYLKIPVALTSEPLS